MTEFHVTGTAGRQYLAYLRKWLPKAAEHVRLAPAEVSVALVGDQTMSRLHEEYMDIPGTTDVLTFEIDYGAGGRVSEGEVVICVPEARRQAEAHSHTVQQELLLYGLHGLLHLSGYDDRNVADHRRMHRKEDEILQRLGIGKIFAAKAKQKTKRRRA